MDKIIQTILQNTSKTAGRASGNQNNTQFAFKKVLLTIRKSICVIQAPGTSWRNGVQQEQSQGLHSATGGQFLSRSSCMASGIH